MNSLYFEISPDQALRLTQLGEEGSAVATMVYRYNNLIGNDLIVDAFIDLLRFINVTKLKAFEYFDKGLSVAFRHRLAKRLDLIRNAIDQRSQGVYTGLEEVPFIAGIERIGMHRVLKALEAYVILLLSRLGKKWNGIVVLVCLALSIEKKLSLSQLK